jgi:hypothetical protein
MLVTLSACLSAARQAFSSGRDRPEGDDGHHGYRIGVINHPDQLTHCLRNTCWVSGSMNSCLPSIMSCSTTGYGGTDATSKANQSPIAVQETRFPTSPSDPPSEIQCNKHKAGRETS